MAAGGGGGGGGGGAVMTMPSNCALGNASVNRSGIRTITPMSAASSKNAKPLVRPRLVFSLPPDSIRLSSNISVLLHRPYLLLDTAQLAFDPDKIKTVPNSTSGLRHQLTVPYQRVASAR